VQIQHVISDITGLTGLAIVDAIRVCDIKVRWRWGSFFVALILAL
jgi:hypothetical protein